MGKRPKKPNKNEQAYKKELSRLKQFMRRAIKRGYDFSGYQLPPRPKKITKASVERLKKITPDYLYSKVTFYDAYMEKEVPGTEGRASERKRAARKAARTRKLKSLSMNRPMLRTEAGKPPSEVDTVLRNLFELLAGWSPEAHWTEYFKVLKERDKNTLASILKGLIDREGEAQIARNAEKNAELIKALAWQICYGGSGSKQDGDYRGDIVAIYNLLSGGMSMEERKALEDALGLDAYEDEEI